MECLENRTLLAIGAGPSLTPEDLGIPDGFQPVEVAEGTWFLGRGVDPPTDRVIAPNNIDAADTTNADQLWPGGPLGLALDGIGLTVGVWDAGKVRDTHQEFGGRITFGDSAASFTDHSTLVAGTIGATGLVPAARGMANRVSIVSFDFANDFAEMRAAGPTIVASNHSYGPLNGWQILDWQGNPDLKGPPLAGPVDTWFGDRDISATEAPGYGKYDFGARTLDEVLFENPVLVSAWTAGNARTSRFLDLRHNNSYVTFLSRSGAFGPGWYLVDGNVLPPPPPDGNAGTGYDSIGQISSAKNSLVVGSIADITADPHGVGDVRMTSYSSWGPTDDGRIKPDLVGNGEGLISPIATSDTAYTTPPGASGTSVAAPNVLGTAVLVMQHYRNLVGTLPTSAMTKGLLIHNAFDAGRIGPDYSFGWGVADGAAAANFLTNAAAGPNSAVFFEQGTYAGGDVKLEAVSDGTRPLKATLVWTDPPGTPNRFGLDERTPTLVHDLDLWINDSLQGNGGNDFLNGGQGEDRLSGDSGSDTLQGSDGNDVLLGGEGTDRLQGNNGQDILIGGLHADTIEGGSGVDIVIGGTTSHDANDAALGAIMRELTSLRDFRTRVRNLRNGSGSSDRLNGPYFLKPNTTVRDDAAVDRLLGNDDLDWFFLFRGDVASDLQGNEAVN